MPNLLLYGGAFDPITKGHIEVLRTALNDGNYALAYLMPCYYHGHGKNLTPGHHRLRMCENAIAEAGLTGLAAVLDFEIVNQIEARTIEVIRRLLQEKWMQPHRLHFLIGSDNANSLHTWEGGEELKTLVNFHVVERPQAPITQGGEWCRQTPHLVSISPNPEALAGSSTLVRNALRSGNTTAATEILPKSVLSYITQHQLYTAKGRGP